MLEKRNLSPYLDRALLDNAVALVTSAHAGRRNVMSVTFFAESSHVPALVRVSIASSTWTHQLISASGWFGLSLLGSHQAELAVACGIATGREGCKFTRLRLRYQSGPQDIPLLPTCLTTSACRVVEGVELPQHTLFVAEIAASFRQTTLAFRKTLLVSDLVNYLGT
jgi:flavin reductase (DIM6/NTAB) family NADH-FMN oxidoreductase RutF